MKKHIANMLTGFRILGSIFDQIVAGNSYSPVVMDMGKCNCNYQNWQYPLWN